MWGMKFEMHRQELWVVTRAKEVDLLIWKGLAIQTPTRGLIRIYQTSIAKCHGLFYLHLDGAQIIWPHIGNCLQYCHKISLSYSRPLWNTKINLGSLGLVILDWNISEIQKKMLWIVQTNTNRLSRGVYFLFFFLISFHEKFFFEFFSFLLTRKFYQNKCDILTRIDFTVSPWTCLCEFDIFCDTCIPFHVQGKLIHFHLTFHDLPSCQYGCFYFAKSSFIKLTCYELRETLSIKILREEWALRSYSVLYWWNKLKFYVHYYMLVG